MDKVCKYPLNVYQEMMNEGLIMDRDARRKKYSKVYDKYCKLVK